jgi:uncharacterized protein (DUF1330 family)
VVEVVVRRLAGHLFVIGFPDRSRAHDWYDSAAYQRIVAFRTDNSCSDVIVAEGLGSDHRATGVLSARG